MEGCVSPVWAAAPNLNPDILSILFIRQNSSRHVEHAKSLPRKHLNAVFIKNHNFL
jgi:hypothetical protein